MKVTETQINSENATNSGIDTFVVHDSNGEKLESQIIGMTVSMNDTQNNGIMSIIDQVLEHGTEDINTSKTKVTEDQINSENATNSIIDILIINDSNGEKVESQVVGMTESINYTQKGGIMTTIDEVLEHGAKDINTLEMKGTEHQINSENATNKSINTLNIRESNGGKMGRHRPPVPIPNHFCKTKI